MVTGHMYNRGLKLFDDQMLFQNMNPLGIDTFETVMIPHGQYYNIPDDKYQTPLPLDDSLSNTLDFGEKKTKKEHICNSVVLVLLHVLKRYLGLNKKQCIRFWEKNPAEPWIMTMLKEQNLDWK